MIMHYTIITESHEKGGFTARCVEIPGAAGYGSTQGEALARVREAIEVVREAQNADCIRLLQRSILRSSRSKSLTPHKSPGLSGEI